MQIGIGAVLLAVASALTFALVWLRRQGILGGGPRKAKPLPKHKIALQPIDPGWQESNYEAMISSVHGEIQQALRTRDRESLEVFCQGKALQTYLPKVQEPPALDERKEILQGSVRQSWNPQSECLVVTLAVSRWVKSWRRYYESWTLQRQGRAWFLVERQPAQEPK